MLTNVLAAKVLICLCCFAVLCCGGSGTEDDNKPIPEEGNETEYYISGTIYSEAANAIDSDVNDSETQPVSNDSFEEAQFIDLTSAVVGGWVSSSADADDYYRVNLSENDIIRFSLPDGASAIIDLFLYQNGNGGITRTGLLESVDRTGYLTVPSTGEYYLRVNATAGSTIYRLIWTSADVTAFETSIKSQADFVPGEALVRFKENYRALSSQASKSTDDLGLKQVKKLNKNWFHLAAEDLPSTMRRLNLSSTAGAVGSSSSSIKDRKNDTLRMINAMKQRPEVLFAEPNYIYRSLYDPNDELFGLQWHLDMINCPEAWDITTGDSSVIVAVVDSGIIGNHPDLEGKLVSGYDFVSDPSVALDGDGPDSDPTDSGDSTFAESSFHGTHVAGIIAAEMDNSQGVAGVGGNTGIMPVRVLGGDGGGTVADIANGIRWAAGLDVELIQNGETITLAGADPPADIINLSLGGEESSSVLEEAIGAAREAGIIIIAAAGNSATSEPKYPAAYEDVVSVAAVDINGQPAYYSNYGISIDVAAPGGCQLIDTNNDGYEDGILSTTGIGFIDDLYGKQIELNYTFYQGTSMAAPQVAGVAALMKAVRSDLTPEQFDGYLKGGLITAGAVTSEHDTFFGYGLIDAHLAVLTADQTDPPTILSVKPESLYLKNDTETVDIIAYKIGNQALTVSSCQAVNGTWLDVSFIDGNADGTGSYQIQVNRDDDGSDGGVYTDIIQCDYALDSEPDTLLNCQVPVTIEVLPDAQSYTGVQYLLLIDADSLNAEDQKEIIVEDQIAIIPENGVYQFKFTSVKQGNYFLLCGTDLDGDGYITLNGEAAGGYPSTLQWEAFALDSNLTGMNFVTGFSQNASSIPLDATVLSIQ